MSNITAKRKGELVRGVFSILKENPEGMKRNKLFREMANRVKPNASEESAYPGRPGVRRYEGIISRMTHEIVKAGWLVKDKGVWYLTEEGEKAYNHFPDSEAFYREARRLFTEWNENRKQSLDLETDETDEIDDSASSISFEWAEDMARNEIEDFVKKINPYEFQDLVAGLLQGMGYHISWIAPPGPDRGIDIIAHSDPLGADGPRVKVQVKRRAEQVGSQAIQSFIGAIGDDSVGVFVCIGGFSKDAHQIANQEKKHIMLVDLERLLELWIEHYEKIPEEERRLLPLRPVHFLALEE